MSDEKMFKGRTPQPDPEALDPLWAELELYPAELDPQLADMMEAPLRMPRSLRPAGLAIAASLVLAASAWLLLPFENSHPQLYQTERGERIVVNLADGSIMQLNSDSRVEVQLDEAQRRIEIQWGEALFDVAKDKARKFVVHTPRGRVEAIGTLFNVNLYHRQLIVTIAEGKVLVSNGLEAPSAQAVEIAVQGQQVIVAGDGRISSIQLDNLQPAMAWTEGKIIFSGESLEQAIEQVNRYSTHRITILDARIRELPVYGVFNVGDSRGFLSALENSYNIDAVPESADLTYLAYRDRSR